MNSTLTASLQLALLKVGTPDRRKTEFSDNVLAVFRAASGDSETTNTIVSGIFKGLLSFDSLDSEEVIMSFLKGVEGSIGFNPFEEPGKLHAILSNLDAPSNDVDISESSPGFWSSFILEALATIVSLVKQSHIMAINADDLSATMMVLCGLIGAMAKSAEDRDAKMSSGIEIVNMTKEAFTKVEKYTVSTERDRKLLMKENEDLGDMVKESIAWTKDLSLTLLDQFKKMKGQVDELSAKCKAMETIIFGLSSQNSELAKFKEKSDSDMIKTKIRCSVLETWKKDHEEGLVAEKKRHEEEIKEQERKRNIERREEMRIQEERERKREAERREEMRIQEEQLAFIQAEVNQLAVSLEQQEVEQEEQADKLKGDLKASTERLEATENSELNVRAKFKSIVAEMKGLNGTVESYGEKIRSLEREHREGAFNRKRDGLASLSHPRKAVRDDLCEIAGVDADPFARSPWDSHLMISKKSPSEAWKEVVALAEEVIANSDSDPALQNYRKLLKGKKFDPAFVSYVFSLKLKDPSDADVFSRYFLPEVERYEDIITRYSPENEKSWARAALAAANAYKSMKSRAEDGEEKYLPTSMLKASDSPNADNAPSKSKKRNKRKPRH